MAEHDLVGARGAFRLAHAKLNLSLEILGRREDGFHDLVSVMHEISLADTISARPASGLSVVVDGDGPVGMENLVTRAVALVQRDAPSAEGAEIVLTKVIPAAAGLGGGSSDAAATLLLARDMWNVTLSSEKLTTLAADLGSDVPFFLSGGTALVLGRGEVVHPLPAVRPSWFALVNPGISVSTRDVFQALRPSDWSSGESTRQLARTIAETREVGLGVNALSETLFHLIPGAARCYHEVDSLAPGRTRVSGSGASVFSVCSSKQEAESITAEMSERGYWTAVARSVGGRETVECAG